MKRPEVPLQHELADFREVGSGYPERVRPVVGGDWYLAMLLSEWRANPTRGAMTSMARAAARRKRRGVGKTEGVPSVGLSS
ncbi:MAG: hypothetical protein F4Z17_12480 [Acidimicrobiia bacterium]|nr:hypothetical protein [Acidimicrobiia bacterium]